MELGHVIPTGRVKWCSVSKNGRPPGPSTIAPPSTPPDLATIVRIVAGFGGWLGRKNDPPPGPKALWQGMTKLSAYVEAVTVIQAAEIKFPRRKRIKH